MPGYDRARPEDYFRQYRAECKFDAINAYGGACWCCGEKEIVFLTIDHIGGGGNQHRKDNKIRAGHSTYLWLQRNGYPDGFRVLCWNCQFATAQGKCPHEA